MELAEELARVCVAVKEAALLPNSVPTAVTKPLFSPNQGLARQATQTINQQVAQKQTKARQASTVDPISSSSIGPIKPINIGIPAIRKGYEPPDSGGLGAPIPVKTAADEIELQNPDLENLRKTRTKFESLAARERLLRSQAKEWEELARARAEREEPGYLNTFTQRMLPVPHTLGEAVTRTVLTGGAGYGGYRLATKTEPFNREAINRVLGAARSSDNTVRPIVSNLSDIYGEAKAQELFKTMRQAEPEVLSKALREADIFSQKGIATPESMLRAKMNVTLGDQGGPAGRARIRNEINNLFQQASKEKLIPKLNLRRWAGTLSGLALGSLVSGLPFALNALYRKGEGGEAAHRAKQESKKMKAEAIRLAAEREKLL